MKLSFSTILRSAHAILVVPTMACAHSTSAPANANRIAAVPTASAPDARQLYGIVLELARDARAQPKLAPAARVIFHGEQELDEPLANAVEALGWIASPEEVPLLPASAPQASGDDSTMRCLPAELRCIIEQPGGETLLTFAYYGEGSERRIVLSRIESSEP